MSSQLRHRASELVEGAYTAFEIKRFNQEHDQRYGWSPSRPMIYGGLSPEHVVGPPGFDKNKSGQDHDAIVWAWHNRRLV